MESALFTYYFLHFVSLVIPFLAMTLPTANLFLSNPQYCIIL
jgi:hypothetical protein